MTDFSSQTVSNGVTKASREELSPENAIRQLLKPFTYRANTINFSAYKTLFAKDGMADHWFGFTRAALGAYMYVARIQFQHPHAPPLSPSRFFRHRLSPLSILHCSEH